MLFFGERESGEAGKIRSDLKKGNESWRIGRGRLARETLAIKWQRDKMLVWSKVTQNEALAYMGFQRYIDFELSVNIRVVAKVRDA